jgi:peptide/nickel transport system substrate-binding protein
MVGNSASQTAILSNIYEGLVVYDASLEPRPQIAKDWEWASDTEVEFTLREGVKFHNGETVTSEDVKYSLERHEDSGSFVASILGRIEAIETPDDTTLVISLNNPFSPLESNLTESPGAAVVVPKSVEEDEIDLKKTPIGTGPFQHEEWNQGSELVMSKFEEYWDGNKPYVDDLTIQMIPDATTRVTALESGEIDVINDVPQQDIQRLQESGEINLHSGQALDIRFFAFNGNEGKLFADKRVRQAASLAINRSNIVQILGDDSWDVNRSPLPKALDWVYTGDVEGQSQNKERARQLLSEAGAENTSFTIKTFNRGAYKQKATAAQRMLNEVGFDVEIKALEGGTFIKDFTSGNFEAAQSAWIGVLDPDGYLYTHFHSEGGLNLYGYSNSDVDELLERGRSATEQAQRREAYVEAQKQIAKDAPWACIATPNSFHATRNNISGYELLATGLFYFGNVKVNQ